MIILTVPTKLHDTLKKTKYSIRAEFILVEYSCDIKEGQYTNQTMLARTLGAASRLARQASSVVSLPEQEIVSLTFRNSMLESLSVGSGTRGYHKNVRWVVCSDLSDI